MWRLITEHETYLEKNFMSASDQELLKGLKEARAAYIQYTTEVLSLGLVNKAEEATQTLFGENYKTQAAYFATIQKLIDA